MERVAESGEVLPFFCSYRVCGIVLESVKNVTGSDNSIAETDDFFWGGRRGDFFQKKSGFVGHVWLTKSEARAMAVTPGRRRGARFSEGPKHIFGFSGA